MTNLLLPLYNYVEFLERNDTCLWQVEPAFKLLEEELLKRGEFYHLKEEAQVLVKCLNDRNQFTSKKDLMITAYYLTPIGYFNIQHWYDEKLPISDDNDLLEVWKKLGEIPSSPFDEINLPQELKSPENWDVDLHLAVQIRNSSSFQDDEILEEFNSDFDDDSEPTISDDSAPLVEDTDLENEFEEMKAIAIDKWNQILSFQKEKIGEVFQMFKEIVDRKNSYSFSEIEDFSTGCQCVFNHFLNYLSFLFRVLDSSFEAISHFSSTDPNEPTDPINSTDPFTKESHIQKITELIESSITSSRLNEIIQIMENSNALFHNYIDVIQSLTLNFINIFNQENYSALKEFLNDESLININEKIEQYSNELLMLNKTICSLFQDITSISKDMANENLWPNQIAILSSCPKSIAHHVVQHLGELDPSINIEILMKQFDNWNPGKTRSPIENNLFNTFKKKPVDYWINLSVQSHWKELSTIALRIISIPPTEAACERVFSARREIMTKHISNIRDNVVEARAHLKAGLYQESKK